MNRAAYFLAGAALLLWSSLAAIGASLTHLSPVLVTGLALVLGGLLGLARVRDWRLPLGTLLLGVSGIGGYHLLLFSAFERAPIVEANLLNYLWPLLIVVLAPVVLPGCSLTARHLTGALLGLAGAVLIAAGGSFAPDLDALPGYLLAAAAALTWALYSLLTKRVAPFGTGAVGAFCLGSGLLCLGAFLATSGPGGFAAIAPSDFVPLALLGLGPMGAAFFLWDAALKRGDPRVIGTLSYLTPLLSTLWLVVFAKTPMGISTAAAMGLILLGAFVGASGRGRVGPREGKDLRRKESGEPTRDRA